MIQHAVVSLPAFVPIINGAEELMRATHFECEGFWSGFLFSVPAPT
jgi:hypothetical protein